METLCKIRDIYRAITQFEVEFEKVYNLSLNEGMLLCTLCKEGKLTSGQIAEYMGITLSNASKVIKEVESKKLVSRSLGDTDKRQMYFSLTEEGKKKLTGIHDHKVEVPELIKCVL